MSVETETIAEHGRSPKPSRGQRPHLADRELVRRERAVARCRNADTAMVLLQAPAGFGKTTVLAQWESEDPRPFRWITADWRHNDPAFLLTSVAAALGDVEPFAADVLAPLNSPSPNLDLVTSRLCDALAKPRRSMVIVLDDLHLIDDPLALGHLTVLIERMPAGTTLAVAARSEPALPLGRLRGRRLLAELHVPALTMSESEAAELLGEAGLSLTTPEVERLVERTEGWAAGLYLAALSLLEAPDVAAGLQRFYGDERLIADYLRDEFLSGLPPPDLDFLSRTSVLDRLNGSLCDAVLDRTGSAGDLGRLARSNLLLIPLDGRDREYRCHALLREMLEAELHRLDESAERELHAGASRWYAGVGDWDRAVPHAIASGDVEQAADMIWDQSASYLSKGRAATHGAWLDQFTEAQARASPPLCLASATRYLNVGNGAQVENWTSAAFAALEAAPRADSGGLKAAARLVRASGAAREGVAQMGADVEGLAEMLPEGSPWRSLCLLIEGVSLQLRGDREGARRVLEDGTRRGSAVAPSIETLCRAQLALLSLDEDNVDEANAVAERANAAADHYGLRDDPSQSLAFAVLALVWARRGRTDDAKRELELAGRLLEMLDDFSPWYEAEARIVLARTLLRLDDVGAARARLGEAGRHLRRTDDATVLRGWLERAWQDADAARAVTGRWPLTPAELRLLHRLPTHLSFREIAEELFVTANTVKTQARSIYRKLGVSSRAEAVACAKSAGLLEPGDDAEQRA
jgi:LuxR family maltose regulon positive regulatory protein